MNAARFRRLARALQDAHEGAHMGHADFRVNGRVFASLDREERHGTAKLSPADQARFVTEAPATFAPASGAWGRQGWTRIHLESADEERVGEALTLAWQQTISAPAPRRGRTGSRSTMTPARAATARPVRPTSTKPSGGGSAAVDAYIAACAPKVRSILGKIRAIVRKEAPGAEDVISYRMPAFRLEGGALIYYAPFTSHIGIYPQVKGDAELDRALAPYRGPKGNLRFALAATMPYPLIRRVVRARIAEHRAALAARKRR
ncbi:MAG: MmcQ/YjbR family DNA-binding protein [Vicinamibacterales bacterium]